MTIRSLDFRDIDTGWRLLETAFQDVNLLIGLSGAGKTRILESLRGIREVGLSGVGTLNSSYWTLELDAESSRYWWQGELLVSKGTLGASEGATKARFLHETILRNDGDALVERGEGYFRYLGRELPRLQESESAVKMLQAEDAIQPLYEALRRWIFMKFSRLGASTIDVRSAEEARKRFPTLDELYKATDLPTILRAYLLQEDHREIFDAIQESYSEIFPTVTELRIARFGDFNVKPHLGTEVMDRYLTVGIRERGVDEWIVQDSLSSGMHKALICLVELALAPAGSVLFIDELENSLGLNCLPEITESLLSMNGGLQLIATSHHPQVINEIPYERWKLVTRKGSHVEVLDAGKIPALQTASSLEKFTQLINLREYEEGIA